MLELVKIGGAVTWIAGLVMLFVVPPLGLIVLLVALLISIYTATKTRQQRHQELIQATSQAAHQSTPTPAPPSPSERLEELERLRSQGAISDVEYESKRQQVLDQL